MKNLPPYRLMLAQSFASEACKNSLFLHFGDREVANNRTARNLELSRLILCRFEVILRLLIPSGPAYLYWQPMPPMYHSMGLWRIVHYGNRPVFGRVKAFRADMRMARLRTDVAMMLAVNLSDIRGGSSGQRPLCFQNNIEKFLFEKDRTVFLSGRKV